MTADDSNKKEVDDVQSIQDFISTVATQQKELALTKKSKTAGAVLTAEQYGWFLDQIDAQQDLSFVQERLTDRTGSQTLADFKKKLDDER